MLEDLLNVVMGDNTASALKAAFLPYLKQLKDFHFSASNPLFWISILILFFLLSGSWGNRKSFSFCSIITVILLLTTQLEKVLADVLAKTEIFDEFVVRLVSLFILSIFTIYYFFIKSNY